MSFDVNLEVVMRLFQFLCIANVSEDCVGAIFDRMDRLFCLVSSFYCGVEFCGYGYNAFCHMSSVLLLNGMLEDGVFGGKLAEL